jgi:PAS domain S-box-containing protein
MSTASAETGMSGEIAAKARRIDEDAALRAIVEGTAAETGHAFYRALVRSLAAALDTYGAWLTEYDERAKRLRALAFWLGDRFIDPFEYDIAGTVCETTVREGRLVHIPDRMVDLYPSSGASFPERVVSYLGIPLFGEGQRVIGNLAVVDVRFMTDEKRLVTLFRLFASRALAEMRRLGLEEELRARQEKLAGLVGSAMDAIVEVDGELRVTLVNAAAEKVLACANAHVHGEHVERLLGAAATRQLRSLVEALQRRADGERSLWIPGGLAVAPAGGKPFPAEATLSRFEVHGKPFYTLILRNVDERLEAEQRIRELTATAEYLSAQIAEEHGFGDIVGRSPALQTAMTAVAQVAATPATVLILGETGTGKELFARAIHERSPRRDRPLVKVNCAAIPATLIESEFFGHERGAFTGATQRREGRFALADGGTIFLDEIGELPLELQGKLLRVLQEGEFEPVGGSRTRKVDVRVIAATNRDLAQAARDGQFRADLYYRLGVFPLQLPPLRERGDDVIVLAEAIATQLARSLGRSTPRLAPSDLSVLRSYPWPGNVRELRNVMERAIITSVDGRLHLDRLLPAAERIASPGEGERRPGGGEILSERALRQLERDNMVAALERAGGRVGGERGAAQLLGVSPSTFKSRMKALGIGRADHAPPRPGHGDSPAERHPGS